MSISPSQNLAELIPSEVILQELQSAVKALPTVASCPVNQAHKATLHPDNTAVWAVCQECGFTGDSVDILKAKYQTQSVESVVIRLEHSGMMKSVPRELVADYQLAKVRRASWTNFINESRHKLAKEQCDQRILQEFGALPPFRKEWQEGFGKFAGTANKEELCKLFDLNITRIADRMLLLPYFDMPGRLANLRIVSYNSKGMNYTDKSTNRSGGLFMLETVPANAEYVIAVDDPLVACKLQMHRMASVLTPLPIVAWHPDTRYWPIAPKRTVFWAPEPTVAMYNQARRVPGACVCTPSNTYDFNKLLQHRDVKNWIHHAMVHAKPWAAALKEHLLSLPEDEALRFSRDLDITPLETGEILFECTNDEKQVLSSVLDLRSSIKNVMVGDIKVIDKDGAWWTHTEKGRLIRVSNAPFVLEKSAHYEGKGSYLIGSLAMDGRVERFMAPAEQFVASPARWLRTFALKKGMGLVQVFSSWDRRLIDVATLLSPEKMPHVDSRAVVGWTPDMTKFTFPCVTLASGRVDECDMGLPTDNMPCVKVTGHPTPRSTWKDLSEDTPINRVFWAVLACVAANACSRHSDYPVRKIGVIGSQRTLSMISTALDLYTAQVGQINGLGKKLQEQTCHDVPVCLLPVGKFKPFVDWLESSGVHNVLVSLNQSQAALLGGKDWLFVDAQDASGPMQVHAGTNLLADVLRMVQTRLSPIDKLKPEVDILERMHVWGRANKCDIEKTVFDGAAKLIIPESIFGSVPVHEGFLFSLFSMIQADQISVSRAGFSKKPGEVEMADKHIRVVKSVLQKMMLPVGVSALTEELENAKWILKTTTNEWYLNRVSWDELYERWASLSGE